MVVPGRLALVACLLVAIACGGGGDGDGDGSGNAEPPSSPSTAAAAVSPGAGQGCLDPAEDPGDATVDWDDLSNPILDLPGDDAALKDHALRLVDGRWRLVFSHLVDQPLRFTVGESTSEDLRRWSPAAPPGGADDWPVATPTGDVALGGTFATPAPDITRDASGAYVVTYQARVGQGTLKPFYRTSADFATWGRPRPLAHELHPGPEERVIDAALAHTPQGLFLGYKLGQTFTVGRSPSGSLDGPWQLVGQPELDGVPLLENYQFLVIDGTWHLLGTSIPFHRPQLFRLTGDPAAPQAWLGWEHLGELEVPEEEWNRGADRSGIGYERANSAYLCDARRLDGWWYLLYAGSTELGRFDGRGRSSLGVARSRDLRTWEVP